MTHEVRFEAKSLSPIIHIPERSFRQGSRKRLFKHQYHSSLPCRRGLETYLICLRHVLVRPPIRHYHDWERVESSQLASVREVSVSDSFVEVTKGEHGFHYTAEFGSNGIVS